MLRNVVRLRPFVKVSTNFSRKEFIFPRSSFVAFNSLRSTRHFSDVKNPQNPQDPTQKPIPPSTSDIPPTQPNTSENTNENKSNENTEQKTTQESTTNTTETPPEPEFAPTSILDTIKSFAIGSAVVLVIKSIWDIYISYHHVQLIPIEDPEKKEALWKEIGNELVKECEDPTVKSVYGNDLKPELENLQIKTADSSWKFLFYDKEHTKTDIIPFHVLYHSTLLELRLPVTSAEGKGYIVLEVETYWKKWRKRRIVYE